MVVLFSLVTVVTPSFVTLVAWALLLATMAAPYVLAGVVLGLALTRSEYSPAQVYSVALIGASFGSIAVIPMLNVMDAPTAVVITGVTCGLGAIAFSRITDPSDAKTAREVWSRPTLSIVLLLTIAVVNSSTLVLRPVVVKDTLDLSTGKQAGYEKWNTYSRIRAAKPVNGRPFMWGASPNLPASISVPMVNLNIDGEAGTVMYHFDGSPRSISFLRADPKRS
jgi:hypothetical protein